MAKSTKKGTEKKVDRDRLYLAKEVREAARFVGAAAAPLSACEVAWVQIHGTLTVAESVEVKEMQDQIAALKRRLIAFNAKLGGPSEVEE